MYRVHIAIKLQLNCNYKLWYLLVSIGVNGMGDTSPAKFGVIEGGKRGRDV
jgi:hypothetical protein